MYSHRQNTLLVNVNDAPAWGTNYTVTAYPTGARIISVAANVFTVDAGHSFEAGDKFLAAPGSSNIYSGTDTVQSKTDTTITMTQDWSSLAGDTLLANLGADTGATTPNYDASGQAIYAESDGGGAYSESRVTCDALGNYDYYYLTGGIWELIRDTDGVVVDLIDGYSSGVPHYDQDTEPTPPLSFATWHNPSDGTTNHCRYNGSAWEWVEVIGAA